MFKLLVIYIILFQQFSVVYHNVTLRGGQRAGQFKLLKDTSNSTLCTELCCENEKCDVALMLSDFCFMVTCSDDRECDPVPSTHVEYQPRVIFRRKVKANENVSKGRI